MTAGSEVEPVIKFLNINLGNNLKKASVSWLFCFTSPEISPLTTYQVKIV